MKEGRLETLGTLENPIADSELSLDAALAQNPESPCPPEILERQRLVTVRYLSLADGRYHRGQVVVDERLEEDVARLFEEIVREGFPLGQAVPVADAKFRWDDKASMAANNTSGFNCRPIAGTDLPSLHTFGWAIDINPALNPYIGTDGMAHPAGAAYEPERPGTISSDHFIVAFLKTRGWEWGGDWGKSRGMLDYHHFQKEFGAD
jgi:hypothetical protein